MLQRGGRGGLHRAPHAGSVAARNERQAPWGVGGAGASAAEGMGPWDRPLDTACGPQAKQPAATCLRPSPSPVSYTTLPGYASTSRLIIHCNPPCMHARTHTQREEADVFPLLEAHLCQAQQRALLYRTIRAMPLRLLERVMPWVVSECRRGGWGLGVANTSGGGGWGSWVVRRGARGVRRGAWCGRRHGPHEHVLNRVHQRSARLAGPRPQLATQEPPPC